EDILAFTRAFQQRFEHQVVALQEALDPIPGIAYPSRSAQERSAPPWSIRRLLLKKWINAQYEKTPIRIQESDLASLPDSNQKLPPLPHSLAFIFRVHNQEIFLEQAGGDHGTALLGRF